MLVMKFGGSSQADAGLIDNVCDIVQSHSKNEKVAVVLSAMGGITDLLLDSARVAEQGDEETVKLNIEEIRRRHEDVLNSLVNDLKQRMKLKLSLESLCEKLDRVCTGILLLRELTPRTLDYLAGFGEIMEASLLVAVLQCRRIKAQVVNTRLLIKTDDHFTAANVIFDLTNRNLKKEIEPLLNKGIIPIITGFIGSTEEDVATTLGRSGSDYTASIVGAALKAKEIWIWTDVNGVMSADPRIVRDAYTLKKISYEEAAELAYFGAKVIHPSTMGPAIEEHIPIRIKNTFEPGLDGTLISEESDTSPYGVKGITTIRDVSVINIMGNGMSGVPGVASRVFATTARERVNVITISQSSSEHNICFSVNKSDVTKIMRALRSEFLHEMNLGVIDKIEKNDNVAILAIVGEDMSGTRGISQRLFSALGKVGVNVLAISQGITEKNVSVIVSENVLHIAVIAVHSAFHLSKLRLHIVQFGKGGVGASLLNQIREGWKRIDEGMDIDLRLVALLDTKHTLFNPDGIDLNTWEEELGKAGKMTVDKLIDELKDSGLGNIVVVDSTASESVSEYYPKFLKAGFHTVTPNKKFNAGKYSEYKELKELAKKHHCRYLYETTVGAGLPVISVVRDLLDSGDELISIKGVFSGTMGYIFSQLEQGVKFSEVVRSAKELGYTEPDPREDLNGMDVARKLLILAREQGFELEIEDVDVESLVPKGLEKFGSIDEFLNKLSDVDILYEEKLKRASKNDYVLRYVGEIKDGKCAVSLQEVPKNSLLGSLNGPDNMIVIQTKRYFDNPLVIRGPGAGPEVTAGGVFADILKVANYLER